MDKKEGERNGSRPEPVNTSVLLFGKTNSLENYRLTCEVQSLFNFCYSKFLSFITEIS